MQLEHPAVSAWRELRPAGVTPQRIDVLPVEGPIEGSVKLREQATEANRKTTVYRLLRVGKADSAVIAKRCHQRQALIERTIYEEILPNLPLPMLHYYGAVEEPNKAFHWLFLEDLSGDAKYQPHLEEHRVAAAQWLGITNKSAWGLVEDLRREADRVYKAAACLPKRGPEHYLNLLQSARDTILSNFANPALRADDLALLKAIIAHCDHLSRHWSELACICERMPQTLVHGDFIKKNVGVRTGQDGLIFFPFDWEKAGWGVPAEDISRVDIPTYWSTVQDHWPTLSLQALERLAHVGKIFRCLVFLDWLAPSLQYKAVEQPMTDLRRCEAWLVDLIRTTDTRNGKTKLMGASPIQLPNLQTLAHSLKAIVNDHKSSPDHRVTILNRETNPRTSTFASELVTCQLADGSQLRLLCKYAAGHNHNTYGHRGGIAYEAEVYRQVLRSLPVSTPTFYGVHKDTTTSEPWLILEYLDQSLRIKDSHDRTLMHAAAHWLGQFHRANASLLSPTSLPFLKRHNAEYYLGWAERTARFAGHLHQRFPWLATLCQRFEAIVDLLLEPSAIIIHGEYYPNNILFCRSTIYPVDWESAAIAMAEIDLASLIEHWPAETARVCKVEYQAARWPEGPPPDFERKLEAVQFYWHFRWLGDRPAWTHQERALKRFQGLQVLGEQFGLI